MAENRDILLEVENLQTRFAIEGAEVRAVDGASFAMRRGSVLAIVGESGCGKSVTAYSIMRLIQKPGRIAGGRIMLYPREGRAIDVTALDERSSALFDLRGRLVSMIFQEPTTALSPVHTIGNQICEAILLHRDIGRRRAEELAGAMLGRVGIPSPREHLRRYPHELSGGMRQRAVIAMALVCDPELLIADEPTTALDVTTQAQILLLMKSLQKESQTSVLLITHDVAVVAQMAEEVAVMYLGRIVEQGPVRSLMRQPAHPYTRGLLESLPSRSSRGKTLASIAGSVPSLVDMPRGCPFHPRCRYMRAGRCDAGEVPQLETAADGRRVACFRAEEI